MQTYLPTELADCPIHSLTPSANPMVNSSSAICIEIKEGMGWCDVHSHTHKPYHVPYMHLLFDICRFDWSWHLVALAAVCPANAFWQVGSYFTQSDTFRSLTHSLVQSFVRSYACSFAPPPFKHFDFCYSTAKFMIFIYGMKWATCGEIKIYNNNKEIQLDN